MKVYLAGPMSGLPRYNFPAFDAAAADLRLRGYDVVSPAELDSPEFRAAVLNVNGNEPELAAAWGDCLARDVKIIADGGVEGIVLMPGWEKSRGARLEATVGLLCNLTFALYCPDRLSRLWDLAKRDVLASIASGFVQSWGNVCQHIS
jgi:hypothetical protein